MAAEIHMTTTAKAQRGARGSEQNNTDVVLIPEVAATTRLCAGTGYCLHLVGSLNNLAPPRDAQTGRTNDLPQTVTAFNRFLLSQAFPGTSQLWLPYTASLQPKKANEP